jgi:hypothetical protein
MRPSIFQVAQHPDASFPRALVITVKLTTLKRSTLRLSQFRQSGVVSSRPPAGTHTGRVLRKRKPLRFDQAQMYEDDLLNNGIR